MRLPKKPELNGSDLVCNANPIVIVYVQGGVVQSADVPEGVTLKVVDMDNCEAQGLNEGEWREQAPAERKVWS